MDPTCFRDPYCSQITKNLCILRDSLPQHHWIVLLRWSGRLFLFPSLSVRQATCGAAVGQRINGLSMGFLISFCLPPSVFLDLGVSLHFCSMMLRFHPPQQWHLVDWPYFLWWAGEANILGRGIVQSEWHMEGNMRDCGCNPCDWQPCSHWTFPGSPQHPRYPTSWSSAAFLGHQWIVRRETEIKHESQAEAKD